MNEQVKENPGALGGATGLYAQSANITHNNTYNLPKFATALVDAVVDFPREDRVPALDLVIEHYSAGQPIPPLMGYMDEAAFWADLACRAELKAYIRLQAVGSLSLMRRSPHGPVTACRLPHGWRLTAWKPSDCWDLNGRLKQPM